MSPNDISADDLLKILGSYHDQKVTDHLYAFGSMLITEIGQRADRIEGKFSDRLVYGNSSVSFYAIGQAERFGTDASVTEWFDCSSSCPCTGFCIPRPQEPG